MDWCEWDDTCDETLTQLHESIDRSPRITNLIAEELSNELISDRQVQLN